MSISLNSTLLSITSTTSAFLSDSTSESIHWDIMQEEWNVTNLLNFTDTFEANLTDPKYKTQLALYDYAMPLFAIIIIVINFVVVVSSGVIINRGFEPTATYLFLGNVALADMMSGIAILVDQYYPKEHRGDIFCSITIGLIVCSAITSIYSVLLIAIDRFFYILHGLKYQQWIYPMRARILIASVWIIGLIIGFLPLMGWRQPTEDRCWFILLVSPELLALTVSIGGLPIVAVCVLYSIILYTAIRKVIQLRNSTSDSAKSNGIRAFRGGTINGRPVYSQTNNKNNRNEIRKEVQVAQPSKWKAVKVVLFTTGSFVVTWVPYFIASVLYVVCDKEETPERCVNLQIAIASPLALLGFLNSLFNPIIYAWWHKGFRTQMLKRLKRNNLSCTMSVKQTSSSSSKTFQTTDGSNSGACDENSKGVYRITTDDPPMVDICLDTRI